VLVKNLEQIFKYPTMNYVMLINLMMTYLFPYQQEFHRLKTRWEIRTNGTHDNIKLHMMWWFHTL